MDIETFLRKLDIKPRLIDTVPIEHAILVSLLAQAEIVLENPRVVKVRLKNHGIPCLPEYYDEYYIFADHVYRVLPDYPCTDDDFDL